MRKIILVLCAVLFLFSCKTRQGSDLNIMQNAEEIATQEAIKNSASTIQNGDQLVILITAKDMDVVRPFNQNYSSSEVTQYSPSSTNLPAMGQTAIAGPTYIVDSEGNIDFPVLGKLDASGKTLVEFKDNLRARMTRYVINPTVNVRLANYKVTVLGEVNRPGHYVVPDGQTTLLNALGLAGDFTMYGKRDDVLLVRTEDGIITKTRINLMNDSFINSPYYNLKQGDVIYVSANQTKEKASRLDPNASIYIAVASIVVTILALVFKK